jgi:malic enzyme
VRVVSRQVAMAVAQVATADGLAAALPPEELEHRLSAAMWQPIYRPYRRASPGSSQEIIR